MPNYHFTISGSPKPDDLGKVLLATDAEALAFGRQVIREMEHRSQNKHPPSHYGNQAKCSSDKGYTLLKAAQLAASFISRFS